MVVNFPVDGRALYISVGVGTVSKLCASHRLNHVSPLFLPVVHVAGLIDTAHWCRRSGGLLAVLGEYGQRSDRDPMAGLKYCRIAGQSLLLKSHYAVFCIAWLCSQVLTSILLFLSSADRLVCSR